MRVWVWVWRCALVATAVGAATVAEAQVRPDSVRRDSAVVRTAADSVAASAAADSVTRARILARTDSIRQAILADSIKTPIARFEMPRSLETSDRLRLVGDSILASGALNLADLLDRVPGVTTYRSGWLAGLHVASYNGDVTRLRVFLDGVEMDAIEPRNDGALDLTDVPLWALDEIVIERMPGELRVWMRTKSVTSTTAATRVDIFTGDLNTNAFRAFFARRWRNGAIVQFGGQQIATQSGRVSAFGGLPTTGQRVRSDGEARAFMGRVGWARGKLSVDAFGLAGTRERDGHTPRPDFDTLPAFKGQRREGYVRVGYGDTTRGLWSHAMASAVRATMEPTEAATTDTVLVSEDGDTTYVVRDTTRAQTQHVLAVGYRGGWWSASLTDRARPVRGTLQHAPVARAGASWGRLDVGAWMERHGRDSTDRMDLVARLRLFPWLTMTAARSTRAPSDSNLGPDVSALRAEAAVRWKRLWVGGGLLREDATSYRNVQLIGAPSALLTSAAATGTLVSVRGPLYKDLRLDVQAINWNAAQFNRAKMHVHAEVAMISEWRRKFPKGQFGINTRLIFDRRGGVPFFYANADGEVDIRTTEVAQVVTGLLEIRIQRGTLFYQYRNLTGGQYEQIRGITMPSAVQIYGIRWEFSN